ncbi:MAG: hypothetical protein V5A18_04585, partial [Haloarculaceae archaeon]
MVGPRRSEERARTYRQIAIGFVLLVAASGGLIALRADAGPGAILAATVGGFVVGRLLVWLAFPSEEELERRWRG